MYLMFCNSQINEIQNTERGPEGSSGAQDSIPALV